MRDIKANMEVIGADGLHIGAIDRVERGRIRLAEKDGRDRGDTGRDRFTNPSLVAYPDTITRADISMMSRCIELSKQASSKGEFPFAALIVKGGKVISEALNEVNRQSDITRHAELLAISKAQQVLGKARLAGCTIYSTIEPCPMCSFPIREARLGRLVFGMASPLMGGFSRWNLLADGRISEVMPEAFGPPPVVLAGVLRDQVEAVWSEWNPLVWRVIRHRGCFDTSRDVREWRPPKKSRGALKTLRVALERYVAPFLPSASRSRK